MVRTLTVRDWGGAAVDTESFPRLPAVGIVLCPAPAAPRFHLPGTPLLLAQTPRSIQAGDLAQRYVDSRHHFHVSREGAVAEGRTGSAAAAAGGRVILSTYAGAGKGDVAVGCWCVLLAAPCLVSALPEAHEAALVMLLRWLLARAGLRAVDVRVGSRLLWGWGAARLRALRRAVEE